MYQLTNDIFYYIERMHNNFTNKEILIRIYSFHFSKNPIFCGVKKNDKLTSF